MPTAARLVGALSLALISFIVSGQIMPLMPEGTDFGYFIYVNIILGLLTGWVIMGPRAGQGATAAVNNGITGVLALLFWGLFVQSVYEMILRAMRSRYDGPFDALLSVLEIGVAYGMQILVPLVILTLLAGGVVAGFVTEFAARNWR